MPVLGALILTGAKNGGQCEWYGMFNHEMSKNEQFKVKMLYFAYLQWSFCVYAAAVFRAHLNSDTEMSRSASRSPLSAHLFLLHTSATLFRSTRSGRP